MTESSWWYVLRDKVTDEPLAVTTEEEIGRQCREELGGRLMHEWLTAKQVLVLVDCVIDNEMEETD